MNRDKFGGAIWEKHVRACCLSSPYAPIQAGGVLRPPTALG